MDFFVEILIHNQVHEGARFSDGRENDRHEDESYQHHYREMADEIEAKPRPARCRSRVQIVTRFRTHGYRAVCRVGQSKMLSRVDPWNNIVEACTRNYIHVRKRSTVLMIDGTAAGRAAQQQPRQMRPASLSNLQQRVNTRWQHSPKLNKHLGKAKKSVATRYLQLESGHAVTGVHLLRSKQSQDARCWWCTNGRQSVAHIMLTCRKWRREREEMLNAPELIKIKRSDGRDEGGLLVLFGESAVEMVLLFIDSTEAGKKREAEDTQRLDEWNVGLLDRDDTESVSSKDE